MENNNNNPKFTMKHYNAIHSLIKDTIADHKQDCNLINGVPVNDNDLYYLIGIERIHDKLGKLFADDNPNFKAKLWAL